MYGSVTGLCGCGRTVLRLSLLVADRCLSAACLRGGRFWDDKFCELHFSVYFLPLKLDLCWSFYQLFEFVDSGDLNLVFRGLLYIIVSFSPLGMWGNAEYCRLGSDTFLVVYI